ncbi:aldo/keto reductase [Nocardiopsis gilva YIM 90087]|uniref:Aldo/keto reductase n=1 Tax=Nocardiopsis gilva YIM 90087 TaxID=1235441 RepID=A0A223S6P2_9ACTN|nr:aldo/keto reductase [Nocardiopsis gilva]ASU83783.1 aldo/keto reductase [Nocardiopsis gilva YIM 90087]
MRTTTLGADGPSVGVIGLGCMGMTWAYDRQNRDDDTSVSVIHRALDIGVNLLDTSDVYGPFTNEELVGRALAERRDEAVLATKVGLYIDDNGTMRRNGRPEHIRAGIDASLRRLGTDHVDLYQLHRVDPDVPIEESWGAMAEAVAAGKVRAIGLSDVSVVEIKRAMAVHPVASVQSELSLWDKGALADVVPFCAENGIAFLPFSPLGRGFLTGRFSSVDDLPEDDWRRGNPRFQSEALAANQVITDRVKGIAERREVPPAQIALAWLCAQGTHVIPIPGTKTPRYLDSNAAAGDVRLSPDELAELDGVPEARGERY